MQVFLPCKSFYAKQGVICYYGNVKHRAEVRPSEDRFETKFGYIKSLISHR